MALSLFAPALIASALAAVGIALAPIAAADRVVDSVASAESANTPPRGPNKADPKNRPGPNSGLRDYNSSQVPQGWRNDAVWGNPSKPGGGIFGSGPRPPVNALD